MNTIDIAKQAGILAGVELLDSNQWRQDKLRELETFRTLCVEEEHKRLMASEQPTWAYMQPLAQAQVESSTLWKRFIDGTPLANDIACWMADFAQANMASAVAAAKLQGAEEEWKKWAKYIPPYTTNINAGAAQEQYDKSELNKFVQNLYDQKMQEGKHGHYETMFHVVHQAIKHVNG